jgi:excisionase family DNA binding protein
MSSTHSVREVAERYGVTAHTVLAWIQGGELRALNVGRSVAGKKPRWRITEQALQHFERLRLSSPAPAPERRKRREDVLRFY